jgi:hypothetical protein
MKKFLSTFVVTLAGLALTASAVKAERHSPNIGSIAGPGLRAAAMVTVRIMNYSNQPIFVVAAFQGGKPYNENQILITEGWWVVQANTPLSLVFPASSDVYLHVQDSNGNELNWQGFTQFDQWYVASTRFRVFVPLGDPTVRMLQSANMATITNILNHDAPPDGWSLQRFFRVGPRPVTLTVNPN